MQGMQYSVNMQGMQYSVNTQGMQYSVDMLGKGHAVQCQYAGHAVFHLPGAGEGLGLRDCSVHSWYRQSHKGQGKERQSRIDGETVYKDSETVY